MDKLAAQGDQNHPRSLQTVERTWGAGQYACAATHKNSHRDQFRRNNDFVALRQATQHIVYEVSPEGSCR